MVQSEASFAAHWLGRPLWRQCVVVEGGLSNSCWAIYKNRLHQLLQTTKYKLFVTHLLKTSRKSHFLLAESDAPFERGRHHLYNEKKLSFYLKPS